MMKRKLKKIKYFGERIDSSYNELEYFDAQVNKKASFLPPKLKKKKV